MRKAPADRPARPARKNRPRRAAPLGRERILDAAEKLIARLGLQGFSMRGLAHALGVEPMSLYHWFRGRGHVMDGLLDRFVERVDVPLAGDWRSRLGAASRSFRASAARMPALFPFVAVHRFNTEAALGVLEKVLSVIAEARPDPEERAQAFRLWVHWMIGFCLDEAAGFSRGPSAQAPPPDVEVASRFPHVAALAPFNQPGHFDSLFEAGLCGVLDGIAR